MTDSLLELAVYVPAELGDLVSAWLFAAGAGGVEERELEEGDEVALVVYAASTEELEAIAASLAAEREAALARGVPVPELRLVRGAVSTDWETEWLRHVRAVPLGDGFVAQPVGDLTALPRGRAALHFRPAWAFGDGTHPTTQLAAAAVERAVRARPGANVLDVGTGSGILALVARAAGAGHVEGIDTDARAIAAAAENLALNPTLAPVALSTAPLAEVAGPFAVVVANITESVLVELAPELARVTAADGVLLVTGVIAGDTARLEDRLAEHGLRRFSAAEQAEQAEWCLLELRPGAPPSARG